MREQITLWHATQIGQDGARLRSILENGLTMHKFTQHGFLEITPNMDKLRLQRLTPLLI